MSRRQKMQKQQQMSRNSKCPEQAQVGKKKILQINKLYYPAVGGIERVVQQIAEGLAEKTDMKVLVCSENKSRQEEIVNGVQVVRVPSIARMGNLPIPLGLTKTLRDMAKEQDIIHLHMPFPFGDLACLLSGYRGKIVLWWHSDVVRQKKLMLFYKPIMLRVLNRADAIVVATEGHIEGSAYLKPFREKCVVIPYGVDRKVEKAADQYMEVVRSQHSASAGTISSKQFEPEQFLHEQSASIESEYKLSTTGKPVQPVRFLFTGRLVYYKGCDILLKAFANVTGAELVMVGTGALENECRRLAENLGIKEKVTFLGGVEEEELYRQFAACDVFVLPSIVRSEAFGLVQIEAMAFGKPVINTNLPSGVPYVSLDKITGLTVPPSDENALAEAMQWMVDHEEERTEMGRKARQRMKDEYREEVMLERVNRLYDDLLSR